MTRTTGQGLTVIEGGDPSTAIGQGMPTADSVDAAIARLSDAPAKAQQALTTAQETAAQLAAVVAGDAGGISIDDGTV